MTKIIKRVLVINLVLVMLIMVGCGQKMAATVNGEGISMAEYDKRVASVKKSFEQQGLDFSSDEGKEMEASIKEKVLDGLIDETLVLQEAKDQEILPTKEEIDEQLQQIKDSQESEKAYKDMLKEHKTTEEDLRHVIKINLASNNLYQKITGDVKEINIDQAREYYQQNQDMFTEPEKLDVRHILFFVNEEEDPDIPAKRSDAEAKKLAQAAIESLDGGADFANLAEEKSEDIGSKDQGGAYEFAPEEGVTDPEFTKAAQALAVGAYTQQPVRSQFGYHVIKLEQITPATTRDFEDVQEDIVGNLTEKEKNEYFTKYLKEIREKAKIEKKVEA